MLGGRSNDRTTPVIPRADRYRRKVSRMTTTKVQYEILDGPAADRIIDSYKYAFTKDVTVEVELTLTPRDSRLRGKLTQRKISATVIGLRYESGTPGMFILWVNTSLPKHVQVQEGGFYNANTRKGTLIFEVPSEHVDRFRS